METSPTISELAKALCKAQSQLESVKKSTENPFFKAKYADLASVLDAARKPLAENGLSIIQLPTSSPDGKIGLSTMLLHDSGEFARDTIVIAARDASNPQVVGSIITYFRRYGASAAIGIASVDEDDDGEAGKGTEDGKKEEHKEHKKTHKTTPGQIKYVTGLFSKTGYKTDSDQLNYAKSVVNHEVTDLNLLTFDECDLIIKTLAKLVA